MQPQQKPLPAPPPINVHGMLTPPGPDGKVWPVLRFTDSQFVVGSDIRLSPAQCRDLAAKLGTVLTKLADAADGHNGAGLAVVPGVILPGHPAFRAPSGKP